MNNENNNLQNMNIENKYIKSSDNKSFNKQFHHYLIIYYI